MLTLPIYKPTAIRFKLIEKIQLTYNVFDFVFEMIEPSVLKFEPGQFIVIDIPNDKKTIKRSYSIASAPSEDSKFTLCVKIVNGSGTTYLNALKINDELTGMGAFGIFTIKDEYKEHLLFIGTGTGIAPMCSMLKYNINRNVSNKMSVLFGVRHEKDIFYDKLLKKYAKLDNIEYYLTLSQPNDDWNSHKGRVTNHIDQLNAVGEFSKNGKFDLNNLRIFVCGGDTMIQEVVKKFKSLGLLSDKIHHEIFF